jgi:outer membrane protein OmpA-like peptidoglycan-associated protein
MRYLVSLLCFVQFALNAQQVELGDKLFDRFDFLGAGAIYESYLEKGNLNQERTEKLVYCQLRTGPNEKGLALLDAILTKTKDVPEFFLWRAEFLRELGRFEEAIQSIQQYQALGGEEPIDGFVKSCQALRDNQMIMQGDLSNFEGNDKFATHLTMVNNRLIYLMEQGVDSAGANLGLAGQSQVFAEGLLLRPYLLEHDRLVEWAIFDDAKFSLHTIRSLQLNSALNKVFFVSNSPFDRSNGGLRPVMYSGDFNGFSKPLTNIETVVGIPDSLTTLQLTFSQDGKLMIFSAVNGRNANLYQAVWDGSWQNVQALTALNSGSDELFPALSGDSLLAFSSNRVGGFGGLDQYTSQIISVFPLQLEELVHLPIPLNSSKDDFLLTPIAPEEVQFASNRTSGKGDDDVWIFRIPPPPVEIVQPEPEPEIDFAELARKWNLKKVYFIFNSSETEEKIVFDQVFIELFNKHEHAQIKLKGHSDYRGTKESNYLVALRRVQWLKDEFVKQGINPDKISIESVGSEEPVNQCVSKSSRCTEAQLRENRFAQLFILH